ncbi:MAG: iron-containing alcohol dehydrogenase [Bacteroidaceae bacterium]|nr:iron-containing alcohol dehydrogenase [Bacteroidaceae bacterium]MEA5099155.1 iron-containing alcohol dehydrogenase [Bacteroidales bacterium]
MYYSEFKSPAIIKTGKNILNNIDSILKSSHLYFPKKILITQKELYSLYRKEIEINDLLDVIFVSGGDVDEADEVIEKIKEKDAIILAFGGGSVLDIVKYCASKSDCPFVTIPSTLSNDAIYSSVSRLNVDGKKKSFGVQPPTGIIVDLEVIKKSPKQLILAGVADLVSNLSAIADWKLAYKKINEPINELAYMLAKQAVMPILHYKKEDLLSDEFLFDLTNGLITSGLSMIVSGNTRGTSGAEHLISHAIDEFFPEKSSIHGLQVGWAHMILENEYRNDQRRSLLINNFFEKIGLISAIKDNMNFNTEDFKDIIPYAKRIRNRYTIFNTL